MKFPKIHEKPLRFYMKNIPMIAPMYFATDIDAWRTHHAGKLANPPELLSLTLTDLTKLNDWLRTLIEEC